MQPHILCKPVKNSYFNWIKSGEKLYEGRLKCKIEDWDLEAGKMLMFYDQNNNHSFVLIRIRELLIFDNFGDAFDELGKWLIPNNTKEEVINLYNDLFHYDNEVLQYNITSQMILDNGVVAIGFEVIYKE